MYKNSNRFIILLIAFCMLLPGCGPKVENSLEYEIIISENSLFDTELFKIAAADLAAAEIELYSFFKSDDSDKKISLLLNDFHIKISQFLDDLKQRVYIDYIPESGYSDILALVNKYDNQDFSRDPESLLESLKQILTNTETMCIGLINRNKKQELYMKDFSAACFESLTLSEDVEGYSTELFIIKGKEAGKVILIMGGVHGNEPAGSLALNQFIKEYSIKNGILVVIPVQNPVAFKKELRCSFGPIPNNYYNMARAFPARRALKERDCVIMEELSGVSASRWWWDGDRILHEKGLITDMEYKAKTIENLVDENGYRRALDPDIRIAGENIYKIMLGIFPDSRIRYPQIDVVIDLHESLYSYRDMLCVDDTDSEEQAVKALEKINSDLKKAGMDPLRPLLSPIATASGWTARYELPKPALSFTVETDGNKNKDIRIRSQLIIFMDLLEHFGMKIEKKEWE